MRRESSKISFIVMSRPYGLTAPVVGHNQRTTFRMAHAYAQPRSVCQPATNKRKRPEQLLDWVLGQKSFFLCQVWCRHLRKCQVSPCLWTLLRKRSCFWRDDSRLPTISQREIFLTARNIHQKYYRNEQPTVSIYVLVSLSCKPYYPSRIYGYKLRRGLCID